MTNNVLNGTTDKVKKLRRSRSDKMLGGVCGGLAPATGLPAWLWRLIFVLFVVCGGTGLLVYVLMWILVPKDDGVIAKGDNAFRAS